MKRSLFYIGMSAACLLISQGSMATGMTLTLDNPYQTALVGQSERVYFSGTIWMPDTCKFDYVSVELPGLEGSTTSIHQIEFDHGFLAYHSSAAPGQGYTGKLFSFKVSGYPAGDYFYSGALEGPDTTRSEVVIYCLENGQMRCSAAQAYGISIREAGEPSVPGPAAAIPMAFGLAASALRKRIKK